MIANFGGDAEVRSVFLPYYCQTCDKDRVELIEFGSKGEHRESKIHMPCPGCGADMEFDDLVDSYLSFRG